MDLGGADRHVSEAPDLATVCGTCLAPTPACDPDSKRCVPCVSDGDCPNQTVCRMNVCMAGCALDHSTCGDGGSCDVDLGLCHGCLSNADCPDPNQPTCDLPSGHCGSCNSADDQCPLGSYCSFASGVALCTAGCKSDFDCSNDAGSAACCSHVCTDTRASNSNCGACGVSCNEATCCNGACSTLQSDVLNCGGCGTSCMAPNAMSTCAHGQCSTGACLPGYADCNMKPADGCEVNIQSDTKNCGGCGTPCVVANASALCAAGVCMVGACNPGYRDCNSKVSDGCEVNVLTDPKNCGTCGSSCANLPNATAGCGNGACVVSACATGYGNCDKVDANGCEAMLSNDPANCGGCGDACPGPANVVRICTNSVCSTGGCQPGYVDCDNNLADGCEANLASDPKNCGNCGTVCSSTNGVASCTNGTCGLASCNAGFADCDKSPQDGCEVNLNTNAANCGACGKACAVNQTCTNGVCMGGQKCSVVATAWCTAKGWTVAAWTNSFPNQPGGAIFCTLGGISGGADCDTCGMYNEVVWKNTAKDACSSTEALVAGNVYGGHNPCVCSPNLYSCGTWPMMGCTPD